MREIDWCCESRVCFLKRKMNLFFTWLSKNWIKKIEKSRLWESINWCFYNIEICPELFLIGLRTIIRKCCMYKLPLILILYRTWEYSNYNESFSTMYVIIGRTFSKQALEKQAQKKFLQNMAHQKVYSMQVRGALLLKVFIVYAAFWILISYAQDMFHDIS